MKKMIGFTTVLALLFAAPAHSAELVPVAVVSVTTSASTPTELEGGKNYAFQCEGDAFYLMGSSTVTVSASSGNAARGVKIVADVLLDTKTTARSRYVSFIAASSTTCYIYKVDL